MRSCREHVCSAPNIQWTAFAWLAGFATVHNTRLCCDKQFGNGIINCSSSLTVSDHCATIQWQRRSFYWWSCSSKTQNSGDAWSVDPQFHSMVQGIETAMRNGCKSTADGQHRTSPHDLHALRPDIARRCIASKHASAAYTDACCRARGDDSTTARLCELTLVEMALEKDSSI